MFGILQPLRSLFQSRLSQRILLWVFISIVVAEILLLLFSLRLQQQEIFSDLRKIATDKTVELFRTADSKESDAFLQQLQELSVEFKIIGGTLYRSDGKIISRFGEPPQLLFASFRRQNTIEAYDFIQARYDEVITMGASEKNNVLILRHDATLMKQKIFASVKRVAGTVLIIGAFVTIATMVGLERFLIAPILSLRRDLLQAGNAISQDREPPEFEVVRLHRQDELGEVITAFFQMHQEVLQAIATRKQAEQAMTRLAEIGELTAIIVHEIRNPLTTIFLELRQLQKFDLSEATQDSLTIVLEEAERLKQLLNEILLYTRSQRLKLSELEVNQWIAEILPLIETITLAQGRSLQFVPASMPCVILGDRNRLKQVFINLVNNACEAIEPGEQITWTVIASPSQVGIQIHNRGLAIPSEEIPKLTQPFYTTKPSGTGLGLAIVKRIVEAHNGELEITSDATTGTTVTVRLLCLDSKRSVSLEKSITESLKRRSP